MIYNKNSNSKTITALFHINPKLSLKNNLQFMRCQGWVYGISLHNFKKGEIKNATNNNTGNMS